MRKKFFFGDLPFLFLRSDRCGLFFFRRVALHLGVVGRALLARHRHRRRLVVDTLLVKRRSVANSSVKRCVGACLELLHRWRQRSVARVHSSTNKHLGGVTRLLWVKLLRKHHVSGVRTGNQRVAKHVLFGRLELIEGARRLLGIGSFFLRRLLLVKLTLQRVRVVQQVFVPAAQQVAAVVDAAHGVVDTQLRRCDRCVVLHLGRQHRHQLAVELRVNLRAVLRKPRPSSKRRDERAEQAALASDQRRRETKKLRNAGLRERTHGDELARLGDVRLELGLLNTLQGRRLGRPRLLKTGHSERREAKEKVEKSESER